MSNSNLQVLNKGFVKVIDHMGSDLSAVNAARISFNKQKEVFDASDEKLLKYLTAHNHTSPFRHQVVTMHVKAPIFVFRQWMKHRIGSEFNEISGRYVEFEPSEFYVPEMYRKQSVNNKQGSDGPVDNQEDASIVFESACKDAITSYKNLISLGICREQARCILPQGMYSEVYWTASLQAIAHFIHLRDEGHAQWEIQEYARAVRELILELYPVSLKCLLE